ncbi:MAG: Calcineurin-like phosphoesterase superfamily domain protein [candidate division CPR1 bacterium ADurb.Bin160]|uniref:Calcineurin-like phosphoesterase superfamily domain protein n=1 Tax=candidate division CPR1 bacterium ADurb.Bin160 TaxID=1852826 RepID=A0A1V5ZJB7_9BACT|nr:MAG: Calcineurin-like phosphoesterase superfamily domain protein [candidate division CPR1 bacterium ADurb.Bin160]
MSKIACIADLHINIFSRGNKMFPFIMDFFKFFKEVCIKEKVEMIIIAGDLFDFKTTSQTEGLVNISIALDELAELFKIIIINGNHDRASKTDEKMSLPKLFHNKKNIMVVDDYKCLVFDDAHLHFLSFFEDEELVEKIKFKIPTTNKNVKHVLFSHFALNGFTMNKYIKNDEMHYAINESSLLNKKLLKSFDKVFLGDFHGHQTDGVITYISSPFQLRHGDEYTEHGFIIIDTNTYEYDFYENPHTPEYVTTKLNKNNLKELVKLKNCYINLVVSSNINKEKLILVKEKLLQKNLGVSIINESEDNHEIAVVEGWDIVVKQNQEDMIKSYLDLNSEIIKKNNWNIDDMFKLIISKE